MNSKDQARFDALKGASNFGANNADDFKPVAGAAPIKAQELFAGLGSVADGEGSAAKNTVLGNLVRAIKAQDASAGDYHGGTASKSVQRDGVLEVLRSWNRTAAAIATARNAPEIMENFRIPHGTNDIETVARARAFADAVEPLKAEFLALGHPADFVDALRQRVKDFEAAASDQSAGLQDRAGATASISDLIGQGLVILKQLDAIMHNKYAGNPEKLAAWLTASNIARSSTVAKQAAPVPPQSQPQATPGGTSSETSTPLGGNGASSSNSVHDSKQPEIVTRAAGSGNRSHNGA